MLCGDEVLGHLGGVCPVHILAYGFVVTILCACQQASGMHLVTTVVQLTVAKYFVLGDDSSTGNTRQCHVTCHEKSESY